MGSRFDVSVVSDNQQESDGYIDIAENEILRIEKLISSWDSASQTSLININAGIKPVIVDVEFFNLIERAIKISNLREGAFDISYASMDRIWKFDGSMKVMPSDEAIKKSVSKVGYHNIVLNHKEHSVFLKLKGMKIGFGAMAKGYTADYFSPYEQNLSTSDFYTSDYDLTKFNANQYGFGFGYTDIFAKWHIWKLGLKSIDLKYYNYKRNTGLTASIITAGFNFTMD